MKALVKNNTSLLSLSLQSSEQFKNLLQLVRCEPKSALGTGVIGAYINSYPSDMVTQLQYDSTLLQEILLLCEQKSAFQAKIESGISVIRNTSSQSNKNQSAMDVPTLSQSVFWQDERQTYQNKYEGGSKLDQLKQLVEDLKSIREQQLKSQEKLGLYIKIENGV